MGERGALGPGDRPAGSDRVVPDTEACVLVLRGAPFGNDADGHRALHVWVERLVPGERRFGIESTGRIARGLAGLLLERGERIVDVRGTLTDRERGRLRGQGKSDPRDALAIARVTARERLPPVRIDSPSRARIL